MSNGWQVRYRQIAEAVAIEFSMSHPDLQHLHSEAGVPGEGWFLATPHPDWCWRRLRECGDRDLLYRIDLLLTGDLYGIYLSHYMTETSGIESPSGDAGRVLWEGLAYDRTNQTAIAKVRRSLEAIWQHSEYQLARVSATSV